MNPFRIKTIDEIRQSADVEQHKLKRVLTARDIIALGMGAIIGAGIFTTTGNAAALAGPAVVLSYAFVAIVCAFAGLCYAELTAMIPVSGSAYTYAFATMGEFVAWIIGWDLILEYAIGNVAVAISWSGYFQSLIGSAGLHLPDWLAFGLGDIQQQLRDATDPAVVARLQAMLDAAPHIGSQPIMINAPAAAVVLAITWLLVRGVQESSRANMIMVLVKIAVLVLFVGVGLKHFETKYYEDFMPNGWGGVSEAMGKVFFAYIGFDAVSTAAEETKNPKRDMPIGILGSLAICAVIYVIVSGVACGLAPYNELQGADPLAKALERADLGFAQVVVSLGAVVSMSAVLLVFQLGQPRIFFAMSRDGLLPGVFAKVHPKYRTPHVTTILTGLVVAIASAFMDDDLTFDLTSIGTLFAFVVACAGVLVLRYTKPNIERPFKVPAVAIMAPLAILGCLYVMSTLAWESWERFLIWLGVGVVIYFVRGMTVRRTA